MAVWNRVLWNRYGMLVFYVGIYLLLTVPFLSTSPLIWADEGLLSEISWRFTKEGVFSQQLWTGYLGFENFSVHPNYLYFLFLALSFKIFGLGIFQARLVSVVAGLFLIFFFYLFVERAWGKRQAEIATLLLAINPLFILSARIVRQEMVTVLFAFLAIGFVIIALKEKKHEKLNSFIAGIFAGMTILTHLNGVFISFSIFALLILATKKWEKDIFFIVYFGVGISVVLLPYIVFILLNWDIFVIQFSNMWSYRLPVEGSLIIRNFFHEPHRWLKGVTTPISMAIGIVAFFYFFPKIKKLKEIYIPLIAMIVFYTFLDYHKYYGYLLIVLPLFCILSSLLFTKYISHKNTQAIAILILFLISTAYVGVEQYKVFRDSKSHYLEYCGKIKEIINGNEDSVILADNLYWFCFPNGNLRDIIIPQVWLHDKEGKSSKEIFAFQNISYVILDPVLNSALHQNKTIFKVPEDYIERIERCTQIGNVEDLYYTRPSESNTTIIYKC